jgi:hypothetical protein
MSVRRPTRACTFGQASDSGPFIRPIWAGWHGTKFKVDRGPSRTRTPAEALLLPRPSEGDERPTGTTEGDHCQPDIQRAGRARPATADDADQTKNAAQFKSVKKRTGRPDERRNVRGRDRAAGNGARYLACPSTRGLAGPNCRIRPTCYAYPNSATRPNRGLDLRGWTRPHAPLAPEPAASGFGPQVTKAALGFRS